MAALFVLLPDAAAFDRLCAALPPALGDARAQMVVRAYPRADDARHLLSLVRAGRDPVATRRWRGLLLSIAGGALLGGLTASILALGFDMLGGQLGLALPFGLCVGAFLGGFTAAMTGTEVARDEVRALATSVRRGDVLVSVAGPPELLRALRDRCDEAGLAWRRRG